MWQMQEYYTRGDVAGINWRFNAWGGKYAPWDLDDQVAPPLAAVEQGVLSKSKSPKNRTARLEFDPGGPKLSKCKFSLIPGDRLENHGFNLRSTQFPRHEITHKARGHNHRAEEQPIHA